MHRVKHTADVVLTKIHEWSGLNCVREAALEDERQIEADDVVSHELVTVTIEVFHHGQEILQRFLLVLFIAVLVDAKHVLAFFRTEAGKLQTRNRPDVQRDREHATRSGAQRAESVATFFLGGDVFKVALLLLDAHVAEPDRALELWADSFAEVGYRQGFDVEGVRAWELWLGVLMFAILFESDGTVFGDDEL